MNQNLAETTARRNDVRVDLERRVAGAVLAWSAGSRRKPYLASDVLAVCPSRCFIGRETRVVMEAMRDVVEQGRDVDLISVVEALYRRAKDGQAPVHQADLAQWTVDAATMVTESSVMEASAVVAGEWRKDEAAVEAERALQGMRAFGASAENPLADLRKAQEILESGHGTGEPDFDARLDEYEVNLTTERTVRPVQSPWANLNRILRGGILPGELCILAARPSVGKSALALNWAWSVACSGRSVPLFSLEMSREQLLDRLVANVGGIDVGAFRQGLSRVEREKALLTVQSLRGRRLDIVDEGHLTVGEIRRRVRIAQRRKTPVGLVAVDYLQLVRPDDMHIPREQQVAGMSRGLKMMAKSLGVPVLLLAQLSRKGEESNREPVLSDLRESGAIEQDADIVIFLHQARKRNLNNPDEPVKFIVAKGRSSGVGRDHLVFRRVIQRFEESTDEAFYAAQKEEEERERPHWQEGDQGDLL